MNIRYKLANWISGGELARQTQAADRRLAGMTKWLGKWDKLMMGSIEQSMRISKAEAALRSIANNTCCEGCQEAARVAREALALNDVDYAAKHKAYIVRGALE